MRSRPEFVLMIVLFALVLGAGCAQQDLYDPPGAPFTRVGSVPLPSENEGVAIIGRHAFVAGGQAGLHSIDFTDPANPVLLQTLNTLKYSESVEVVRTFVDHTLRDIALVVEGTEGITSYDITDPGAMTSFNSGTTAVFGNRVYIDQPEDPDDPYVVFLAESWKGVRIFESIPAQAGILAYNGVFVGTQGYAEGIAVKDGYAYVADDEMGMCVLDVRILDLDSVELVSWTDTPGEALDVELAGNHAYVADGYDGLAVFRIDGGATPVKVAQLPLESRCRAVAVRDDLCVLAAQGGGVHFVDVSNPADPIFLGRIVTEYAMDLAISNEGFVLVVDRDEGLVILEGPGEFTDTTPPSPVTSLTVESFGLGAVRLDWFAVGDDRMEGTAESLEIRMADSTIVDADDWAAATVVPGAPAPETPGTETSLVVTELTAGEKHFAVRYTDNVGLQSTLGSSASAQPGEGILLLDGGVDIQAGTTGDTYTFEITFIYSTDPTVHEVIIDGTGHTMDPVETRAGETLYRYQAVLPAGQHTHSFHFAVDDPEVPAAETDQVVGPVVGRWVLQAGSPDDEPGRTSDEWAHTVVLTDSVVAAVTEVTQSQYEALGFTDPSGFDGDDLPVESLTWHEAVAYCNALSTDDGLTPAYTIDGMDVTWNREADGWRLPTEAEWEFLCRAGSGQAFSGGALTGRVCTPDPVLNTLGWYCGSDFGGLPGTRAVMQKDANARGLHDMHGNVWEWCWNWYGDYRVMDEDGDGVLLDPVGPVTGTRRVVRGGSWYGGSEDCRSANREARYPDNQDDVVGLRVVRTVVTDR